MTEQQERRKRWIFQVLDLINLETADFEKRITNWQKRNSRFSR